MRAGPSNQMVGTAGFELATPCTPCKCATRLRYAPTEPTSISGNFVIVTTDRALFRCAVSIFCSGARQKLSNERMDSSSLRSCSVVSSAVASGSGNASGTSASGPKAEGSGSSLSS